MTLVVVTKKNTHVMTLVDPYVVCEKNSHEMTPVVLLINYSLSHCMCVLIQKLALESLQVCYFHIPHMDPPVSLHVCSFLLTTTIVIACVFS